MNKLRKYLLKRGKDDLLFAELNSDVVADIRKYMHDSGMSNNTINSYLKIINSFISAAIKEDVYVFFRHPFASVTYKKEEVVPDSLTQEDIEKIISTPISSDHFLYKYKLTFLFQFFAQGMRISDVQQLRFNMLKTEYIVYNMRKTASPMLVHMNKNLIEILKVVVRKYHINDGDPLFAQLFGFEEQLVATLYKFKKRIEEIYRVDNGYHLYLDGLVPLDENDTQTLKLKTEIEHLRFNTNNFYVNAFARFFSVDENYKRRFIFQFLADSDFKNIGEDNDFSKMTEKQYKTIRNNNIVIDRGLKKIQKLAGLSTDLKSHLARHSYTSQLLNTEGADIYMISKSLGHSDVKTTQSYISRFHNKKIDQGNRAISDKYEVKL